MADLPLTISVPINEILIRTGLTCLFAKARHVRLAIFFQEMSGMV
jgi:hypothetical protein